LIPELFCGKEGKKMIMRPTRNKCRVGFGCWKRISWHDL